MQLKEDRPKNVISRARHLLSLVALLLLLSLPAPCLDLFEISQAAFVGASVADVTSSWGKMEANPLWRGRVGARHALIKAGLVVGLLIIQRKFKGELNRPITVVNFALSAGLTGVSIRNMRQAR